MREILFKAKRIDNGEWVEGYVFDDGFVDSKRMFVGGLVIMNYKGTADDRWKVGTAFYEVDPNTICQYTGLTDKNGNKIWENDVVHLFGKDTLGNYDWKAVVEFGNPNSLYSWGYQLKPIEYFAYNTDILCWVGMEEANIYCEVIGNAFDNTKLIKECD